MHRISENEGNLSEYEFFRCVASRNGTINGDINQTSNYLMFFLAVSLIVKYSDMYLSCHNNIAMQ